MDCLQTITLFLLISDISATEIFSTSEEVSVQPSFSSNRSLTCSEQLPDSCPPALFCKDGECACGKYPFNFVKCNRHKSSSSVKRQYCVTYDEDLNTTLVGHCSFISNWHRLDTTPKLFYRLPPSVHQLAHVMCSVYNRTGTLCGQCLKSMPKLYALFC